MVTRGGGGGSKNPKILRMSYMDGLLLILPFDFASDGNYVSMICLFEKTIVAIYVVSFFSHSQSVPARANFARFQVFQEINNWSGGTQISGIYLRGVSGRTVHETLMSDMTQASSSSVLQIHFHFHFGNGNGIGRPLNRNELGTWKWKWIWKWKWNWGLGSLVA